jgi:Zn-dependent peptidase ImmA (M78 family)
MIGSRLRLAREAAGMSLRALEEAIYSLVSAQAIGKYENDLMMPGSSVLLALARALHVSPEYLLSPRLISLQGVDFRKEPTTSSKDEKAVTAFVIDRLERYLAIESLLPHARRDWLFSSDDDWSVGSLDAAEDAAERLRALWNLGTDPIASMVDLLEEKGIKVIALDLPEAVSGSKAFAKEGNHGEVAVIVVNQKHNGERQRFTLAHELAHLVLKPVGDVANDDDLHEKVADRFAGAFLAAKDLMYERLGRSRTAISLGEIIEQKKFFKLSCTSVAVRCLQLGILNKAAWGKLWGLLRSQGLVGKGAREPEELTPEIPKRMERLCLHAVSEGAISDAKAAEILGISIRKLDEILTPQMRGA